MRYARVTPPRVDRYEYMEAFKDKWTRGKHFNLHLGMHLTIDFHFDDDANAVFMAVDKSTMARCYKLLAEWLGCTADFSSMGAEVWDLLSDSQHDEKIADDAEFCKAFGGKRITGRTYRVLVPTEWDVAAHVAEAEGIFNEELAAALTRLAQPELPLDTPC